MPLCRPGVRRMGPGSCTVLSLLLVLGVGVALAQNPASQIDTQQLLQALRELRELYTSRGYAFGNKRIPGYGFGLGKRYRQNKVYGFGLGKRSIPVDYDVDDEAEMPLEKAEPTRLKRSIDEQEDIDAEKRSKMYSFGLGKRESPEEEKRARSYAFGLGKRESPEEEKRARSYAFGLGKRDIDTSVDDNQEEDQSLDGPYWDIEEVAEALKRANNMYSFGLGKRGDGYNFGLGKRENSYGFGLGKRGGSMYGFGLGKRDRNMYGFGLGKRGRGSYSFGLGKRGGDKMYGFGLGKRGSDYGFGLGKRVRGPYSFGLGKREQTDDNNYGVWRRSYNFGLGKRSGPYSFGIGKRSVEDTEEPTQAENIVDEKAS